MVSAAIYRSVEFDTSVICHVPSCPASPEAVREF